MKAIKINFVLVFAFLSLGVLGLYGQGPGKSEYMKGETLRKQKRFDEAVKAFDEAIKLEPGNYRYTFASGKTYYSMKDYDLAIAALEETVEYKSDFTPAYSLIAKIYQKKGDNSNAMHYYDMAFQNESNANRKVSYKMEAVKLALKDGDTEGAQRHISQAKQVAPDNVNILYFDAKLSNQNGDYTNAKNSMLALVSKLDDNVPPAQAAKYYYELGVAYNKLGDYNNASKAWENAYFGKYKSAIDRERSKNSPAFYYRLAVSYYTAGQYDACQGQIDKALEIQNNFSPAYILLGKIAKKRGNYSEAISHYESAVGFESDPKKKAKLTMMTASLQLDAGDYSGALNSSNEFLRDQGNNPRVMYFKALSQYYLGQYSSSINTLEDLLGSSSIDNKSKAKYNFILGMAAKNTDPERAKSAFKAAMYGPFKPAAKNELDKLLGGGG